MVRVLTLTHHMGEGPYFFIGTESLTIHMVRPGGARLLRRGVTHYSYGEGFGDVAWGEGGPSCIDLESFMVLLSLCLLVPLVDGSTAQKEVILFNLI
jgi:hypothetical protein